MSDAEAVRREWSDGDYPSVAERLRPAADALLAALEPLDGLDVLDVATGTGNLALAAARAGAASVVGVDLTPELLAVGRRAAEAEGLAVDFLEGDAEALEFEEDRFDVVTSTFGVIFAPQPAVAAGELARVCTPGGRIGLTTWPVGSTSAAMSAAVARHVPGADPQRVMPPAWATEDGLRELFAPRGVTLEVRSATLHWRFADAAAAVDFVTDKVAGMRSARRAIQDAGQMAALRDDLRALYEERGRTADGQLVIPFDYLLIVGTKTG